MFLLTLLAFFLPQILSETELMSDVVTEFGTWKDWKLCPLDTFIVSMQVEMKRESNDNYGMYDIAFECVDPYEYSVAAVIAAVDTSIFKNGSQHQCDGLGIGFQINSAIEEIALDNTAANNFRLYCSGLNGNSAQYVEGIGEYNGEWTSEKMCGTRQALCGIRVQREDDGGDDSDVSGINNVRMKCCDLPSPAAVNRCKPKEEWELVQECDNIDATETLKCNFVRQVGVGTIAFSKDKNFRDTFYRNELYGFKTSDPEYSEKPYWLYYDLAENFKSNGKSKLSGENWNNMNSETFGEVTQTELSFDVHEGFRSEICQLVGTCNYFTVKTARFKKVDYNYRNDEAPDSYCESEAFNPIPTVFP